jgi:hypothetical protein
MLEHALLADLRAELLREMPRYDVVGTTMRTSFYG